MCYEVDMYVARVPNRGSPPAILLRESYREGGKVKNRTLANLSRWPEPKVDALTRALKGLPPRVELAEAFEITRSLPHGHVAAVLGTARRLGIEELIDPAPSRKRDLVLAMLIAQVIAPASKLAIARALRAETATSSLGAMLGVRRATRTTCMRRWTGRWPARTTSKTPWPPGIWPRARWCSMTCPGPRSRAAAARWGRSGTPATGSKADCRSSTGCCAPPPGCRWPSRCSRATPPTRKPWPPRSPNSRTGSG